MDLSTKELLEQRAVIGRQIGSIVDTITREKRSMNTEELASYDKMEKDMQELTERYETVKRVERSQELLQPKEDKSVTRYKPYNDVTPQDKELAFKAWCLHAAGKSNLCRSHHEEAIRKTGFNLNTTSFQVPLGDYVTREDKNGNPKQVIERAQSSEVDSQGGYLQNDGVFQSLERNLKWFGGARRVAKIIRTDNGEPLSWGYSDDTANLGAQLGQATTVSNTNVVYKKKTVGEYTYVTGVYPVSIQLLQDARINVSEDIGEALGIRLGRITNTDYTTGNGASKPYGFLSEATAASNASNDTFVYGDLISLKYSVDYAYIQSPSFAWTMSLATWSGNILKMLDGNDRPLVWNQLENLASGSPFMIDGNPVIINNAMPAATTGLSPIAVGDWSKFIIRDVREATIEVLRERYMDQLSIGFIGYLRTDCKLLNPNAVYKMVLP